MSWDNTAPSALTVPGTTWDNTAPPTMATTAASWNNVPPTPITTTGQTATLLYTSDFTADADGWTPEGSGALVAGNIDSIGSLADNLRLTLGTAGGTCVAENLSLTGASYRLRVQFRYFIPVANTTFGNGASDIFVLAGASGSARVAVEDAAEGAAWSFAEIELTQEAADIGIDELRIGVAATVTAGDLLYLRDIKVWRIT